MSATPLAGLLVVDLSRHLPGPLAARILRDLGTRVLKVEEPRLGDPVRQSPPFRGGKSALATLLLSGVESIALDLKRPEARGVVEGFLADADVLLETFRPGTLSRLGLDPVELRRRHPRLIICSLSGWGQEGPHAQRSGHDLTYQAVAGTLAPTASLPAVPVADLLGAWSGVVAILAALWERQRSGQGCWIDASLFDAAVHANLLSWAEEAGGSKGVGEPLLLTGALPGYNLYPTADGGYLALGALEPHFWRRFCRAVERKELLRHQFTQDPEVRRKLAALISRRTRREWAEFLAEHDIPGEPLLAASEAQAHPHMAARDLLSWDDQGLPRLRFPARFDGVRPEASRKLPELGEQTAELLAEWGRPEAALSRWNLRSAGVGRRLSLRRILRRLAGS